MRKTLVISGYVSLDRILNIESPAKEGFTSIVTNDDNNDIYMGGCPINIAVALSKLNVKIKPLIRVGKDYESSGLKGFLEDAGVITEGIEVVEEAATSKCYLVEDKRGSHITLFYQGAQNKKYFKPLKNVYFKDVSYGILTVGNELDNYEFYEKCKKNHIPLIFGMKADFDAFPHNVLKEILLYSSIIFMNESEQSEIERRMNLDRIEDLFNLGNAQLIITTHGSDGSEYYWRHNGELVHEWIPICKPQKVVDFTGCGDAYVAGFLYGYMNQWSIRECCMYGSVLSSFVIEKRGCCTNLPEETELYSRYNQMRKEMR